MAKRILVVDDEENVTDFLRLGLQYEGYEVRIGTNGLQALTMVEAQPPDLVILDVMLPLLDGLDVCRRIRSLFRTAERPNSDVDRQGRGQRPRRWLECRRR